MADITYIGTTYGVSANAPATFDGTGFAALTYTNIGEVLSFDGFGDAHADVTATEITSGRTKHMNGAKDGGAKAFDLKYAAADGGQVIIRTQAGSNTTCSIKKTFPDGKIQYVAGFFASLVDHNETPDAVKGQSGEFRVNSVTVTV